MKNVPNKYTYEQIKSHFDERHLNRYNDLKVPWDNSNNAGKSYLFINFRHPLFVYEFYMDHQDKKWTYYESKKKKEMHYAVYQPEVPRSNDKRFYKMTEEERETLQNIINEHGG